jgi:putative transposase
LEFHSGALEDTCAQIGINIQFSPVASPRFKGKVERWFGSVARSFSHQIPGTTFSSVAHRGDYDSRRRAAVSFDELVVLLHYWIIECYIREPHAGITDVPLRLWEEGTRNHPVTLPDRLQDLDALLGGVEVRKVSRKGIEFQGLLYNGEELRRIRTRPGAPATVKFRFDPSDLGQIRVIDPVTGVHVMVPAVEPEYAAGRTLAQHKAISRYAKEQVNGRVSVAQLCHARDKLRCLIDEVVSDRPKGAHSRVARHLGLGSSPLAGELPLPVAVEPLDDCPGVLEGAEPNTSASVAAASSSVVGATHTPAQSTENAVTDVPERPCHDSWSANGEPSGDDLNIDPSEFGFEVVSRGRSTPGKHEEK